MLFVKLRPTNHLLAAVSVALAACTGVHHYTYEIEYTTDQQPHTVQLWYDEGQGAGEKPAYSLTFPQSYYAYRDNHDAEKQTTIGLLLDRRTLKPLTELIAAETGVAEPLEVPAWQEGPLKKLATGKYADRQLFVTIRGRTTPTSAPTDPARIYGEMYQKVGEKGPFTVYKVKVPPGQPDRGLPPLAGFATTSRDIRFHCLSAVARCSVDQPYRDSTISISLGRANLDEAPALMTGIRKVLDQHLT
jgi:hypothetical protein